MKQSIRQLSFPSFRLAVLVAVILAFSGATASSSSAPSWGYELDLIKRNGQLQWGDLPQASDCKGKQQSPIDINLSHVRPYNPGENKEQPQHWFGQHHIHDHPLTQQFERKSDVMIDNDAHTIFLTVLNDDPKRPRNILSGAPLPPGAIYQIRALHFHAPAEHLVNHVQFPLEMHVVYDLIVPSPRDPVTFEHAYPTYHNGQLNITYSRGVSTLPPVNATPAAVVGYLFQQHDGCTRSILSEIRRKIEATPEYQTNKRLWSAGNVPHAQRPQIRTKMDLSELLLFPYGYELEGDPCLLRDFNSTLPPMPREARDRTSHPRNRENPLPAHTVPPLIPRPVAHTATNYRNIYKLRHESANPDDISLDDESDTISVSIDPSALIQARAERRAAHNAAIRAMYAPSQANVTKEYFSQLSPFARRFELSFAHLPAADANVQSSGSANAADSTTGNNIAQRSLEEDIKSRVQEEALRIAALKKVEERARAASNGTSPNPDGPLMRFGAAFPSFYSYRGSLTTPPCSQIITWLVGAAPIAATGEDIQFFWDLFYGNARLTQPVNGRSVSLINVTSASVERIANFPVRPPHKAHHSEGGPKDTSTLPIVNVAEAAAKQQAIDEIVNASKRGQDTASTFPEADTVRTTDASREPADTPAYVGFDVDAHAYASQTFGRSTHTHGSASQRVLATTHTFEAVLLSIVKVVLYTFLLIVLVRSTLYVLFPSAAYYALDLSAPPSDSSSHRSQFEAHRPSLAKIVYMLNRDIPSSLSTVLLCCIPRFYSSRTKSKASSDPNQRAEGSPALPDHERHKGVGVHESEAAPYSRR